MASDIHGGAGFALLYPHGDTAEAVVKLIPTERAADLVYFNPSEPSGALGLNILESAGAKKHLVVSGIISVFKRIWSESWGPRMEHPFRYALTTLAEVEGTPSRPYRGYFLRRITAPGSSATLTTSHPAVLDRRV